MKKFIKLTYIVLFVLEALTAFSVLLVWSMRPERRSLYLWLCLSFAIGVFVAALILINAAVDLLFTKARNKKICAWVVSIFASQSDYTRYVGLLSQALLLDEKITGTSKLFIKKIKQRTEVLSDASAAAEAAIKRLS